MYHFIHPTKTGGTALERYFQEHYSEYITGRGHTGKCGNQNNSIMVVRDVEDRFQSIYRYWKYGATDTEYQRTEPFLRKYSHITIKDFIQFLKNQRKTQHILCHTFTRTAHFAPISTWMPGFVNTRNVIIIQYCDNLDTKVHELLRRLGISDKHIELPRCNVSAGAVEPLDEDDRAFLRDYFRRDYELWEKITHSPEQFRMVL